MQSLGIRLRWEGRSTRRWLYACLAILSAAITTWALHVTQESWRPPDVAPIQTDPEVHGSEIEELETELLRIQQRLDELRSSNGP